MMNWEEARWDFASQTAFWFRKREPQSRIRKERHKAVEKAKTDELIAQLNRLISRCDRAASLIAANESRWHNSQRAARTNQAVDLVVYLVTRTVTRWHWTCVDSALMKSESVAQWSPCCCVANAVRPTKVAAGMFVSPSHCQLHIVALTMVRAKCCYQRWWPSMKPWKWIYTLHKICIVAPDSDRGNEREKAKLNKA